MRDPNRIDIVLQALGDAWRKSPDLRLTQLLVACIGTQRGLDRNDIFYIEDNETLEGINSFISICESRDKE